MTGMRERRAVVNCRSDLRRRYRNARRGLPVAVQRRNALCIARHFLASPLPWRSRRIAAFLAFDGEPNLEFLLMRLEALGKALALPVLERGAKMRFCAYRTAAPLRPNRYGIAEPALGRRVPTLALDLVLTPLVAFDDAGHRLGMGAGFYDRHFGPLPPALRPPLVGVAHEVQRAASLSADPWEAPLDAILTEAGWQAFSSRLRFLLEGTRR